MSSNKPAALPAASNIVSLKTLAEYDRDVLKLILERLTATSAAAMAQLNARPKPLKIPERVDGPPARDENEYLRWEILSEVGFLGGIAQAIRTKPSKAGRKGRLQ